MDDLTPRQREVFDFILDGYAAGRVPTLREICGRFGFRSLNGAQVHLTALEKKGVLAANDGIAARGIEVVGLGPYLAKAVAEFRAAQPAGAK